MVDPWTNPHESISALYSHLQHFLMVHQSLGPWHLRSLGPKNQSLWLMESVVISIFGWFIDLLHMYIYIYTHKIVIIWSPVFDGSWMFSPRYPVNPHESPRIPKHPRGTCCTRTKTSCSSTGTRMPEAMPGSTRPTSIPGRDMGVAVVKYGLVNQGWMGLDQFEWVYVY